jgi:membrane associated rhomboid family serine protease
VNPRGIPWVTLLLIVLSLWGFWQEVGLGETALAQFIDRWGVVPARHHLVLETAPERVDRWGLPILTSMFLHGGLAHLAGNMLFLWIFGDGVEYRLGRLRFLLFYLASGFAAAFAESFMHPGSTVPMIGASGAIAGVLGAYLLFFPRARITMMVPIFFWPFFFTIPALTFLGFWFLQQLVLGAVGGLVPEATSGVAWWAHAGGFVAGFVLGPILARADRRNVPGAAGPRRQGFGRRRA